MFGKVLNGTGLDPGRMGQDKQKLLGILTRPVSRRRLFQPAQAAVPHRWAEQGHEPMPVAEAEKRGDVRRLEQRAGPMDVIGTPSHHAMAPLPSTSLRAVATRPGGCPSARSSRPRMPCTLAGFRLQWPCRLQSPAGWMSVDQPKMASSGPGQRARPTSMGYPS